MRVFDTARSTSNVGLQVLFVILGGLSLAWLVLYIPDALVIAAILVGIFFVCFLRRPALGLLVVLLVRASTDATLRLVPSLAGSGPAGALLTPNLGLLIVLMAGGGLVLLQRRLPFLSLPGGVLLALLLATGLIGTLRSESLFLAFDQWLPAASALIVYALAASVFSSPQQVRRVIDVLAASFVVPAAFGFYQLVTGQGGGVLPDLGVTRIHGTFVQANAFGLYLVFILSVFVSQALVQSGRRKFVALVIVALASVLLLATFSRFAWVGAVIVLLTVGSLRARILLIILPLVIVLTLGLVPIVGERFSNPLGGSFADRVSIWRSALFTWKSVTSEGQGPFLVAVNRLAGLGPGTSLFITYALQRPHPHNDYVRILIDYGVLGLGFYLSLLTVLVVKTFRSWQASTDRYIGAVALSFLALTLAYSVMSTTGQVFGLTFNQVYFWTLAGLVASAGRFASRKDRSSFRHLGWS